MLSAVHDKNKSIINKSLSSLSVIVLVTSIIFTTSTSSLTYDVSAQLQGAGLEEELPSNATTSTLPSFDGTAAGGENMSSYENSELGYRIEYPSDWQVAEVPVPTEEGIVESSLFTPFSGSIEEDLFTAEGPREGSVVITAAPAPPFLPYLTPENLTESLIASQSSIEAQIEARVEADVESEIVSVSNYSMIRSTYEIPGAQLISYQLLLYGNFYQIGVTEPTITNNTEFRRAVDRMLSSFEIIEPAQANSSSFDTSGVGGGDAQFPSDLETAIGPTMETDGQQQLPLQQQQSPSSMTLDNTTTGIITTDDDDISLYENPEYGIQIRYPQDWIYLEREDPRPLDFQLVFTSSIDALKVGRALESEITTTPEVPPFVSVIIMELPFGNADVRLLENVITSGLVSEGDEILSTNFNATLSDMPAFEVVFVEPENRTKGIVVGTTQADKAYGIIYASHESRFDQSLPIAQDMISSFTIANVTSNSAATSTMQEEEQQQQRETEWVAYENATYGVSMLYPSTWTQQDGTESGRGLIDLSDFLSPREADGAFAAVLILIEDLVLPEGLSANMALEEYLNATINVHTQGDPPRQIISSSIGDLTLAGMPAYSLEYTYTDPGSGPQRVLEVATIVDSKAYNVLYFAEPHIYQKYLPIIEEMISSMQLSSDTGVQQPQQQQPQQQQPQQQQPQQQQPQQQQEEEVEWLLYENATYEVRMLYPSTWTQQDGTIREHRMIVVSDFFPPQDEGVGESYAAVSIVIDDMPQSADVGGYLDEIIGFFTQDPNARDLQIISSSTSNFTLAEMPAYTFDITYTDPEFGPEHLLEVGTIFDNRIHYIRYLADPPIYQRYLPIVQEMIESFQIRG